MAVQEWLGDSNQIGIDIWEKKYRYNNETFDEWLDRVSGGDKELRQLIKERKFLFGGRTLSNRGTEKRGSFSNCYSRGFVEDSLDDIMQANTDIATTFKAQGGQGVSLSKLRPKGCGINHGQFKSDGIVPFMEIFNTTTESISQGGSRKGALIISLDIWHKEASEFITIKTQSGRIQKANLSLEIDDEFMECVKKYYETGEVVVKTIKRTYGGDNYIEYEVVPINIYKKMMEAAYDWAEPGCIFTNRFRNYNLMQYCDDYQIETCNPCGEQPLPKNGACLSGETLVVLPDRVTTIDKLTDADGERYILSNDNKFRTFHSVVNKGVKPVYEMTLSNGLSIKATADHRFETSNGLKQLKDIAVFRDSVKVKRGFNMSAYGDNDELYEMFGWMHGDGWITEKAVGISFNNKDGDFTAKDRLLPLFKDYFECGDLRPLKDDGVSYQLQVTDNTKALNKCLNLGFVFGRTRERKLPTTFYDWTMNQQFSFMRGLFAADGNVQGKSNSQVFLYSSSEELMKQVQKFLASIGIHSNIYTTVFKGERTKNRNPQYKVGISKESASLFMDLIGFNGHKKGDRFVDSRYKDEDYYDVASVSYVGEETVYDIMEVNKTNMFFANGMSVHNCNLGSINLSEFVHNPFTVNAYFSTDDFVKSVHIAIRAMDEVVDENLNNHALKEQREMAQNYRNVGLGVMGLHDALIKLGMTYGSDESIEWTDHIMATMFRAAVIASVSLAKEKGCYPMYNENLLKSDILRNHFTEDELNQIGIREYGMRNCSLLSIAPTGSLGTMLNISTGCEPLFALYYNRKTESLNGGEDKYYKVYSGVVKEYVDKYGEDLPSYFVCSGDINWKDRVNMQAALQNHVDTAISSTINLPNEISLDEIEQLYLYSWERGLKGVTIFRDGCKRVGILTTENSGNNQDGASSEKSTHQMARGEIIKAGNDCVGLKRTLYTGCGTLHCEAFFDPKTGELRETYFSKGSSGGCNNFMIGLSRMISLASRGGVSLEDIVDQMKSSGTCPSYAVRSATKRDTSKGSSCPVAIGNALLDMHNEFVSKFVNKDIIEADDRPHSEQKSNGCPVCGSPLVFEGGCNTCKNCGWSKCE